MLFLLEGNKDVKPYKDRARGVKLDNLLITDNYVLIYIICPGIQGSFRRIRSMWWSIGSLLITLPLAVAHHLKKDMKARVYISHCQEVKEIDKGRLDSSRPAYINYVHRNIICDTM